VSREKEEIEITVNDPYFPQSYTVTYPKDWKIAPTEPAKEGEG